MSDRYPFIGDKTVITHDGSLVWSGQVAVQSNLDFSNVSDATLTDSMSEGYVTAIEDNETQYLSVLETSNDITLEDLHNLTLGNSKIGAQEVLEYDNETVYEDAEVNPANGGDQQVVVFTVDGSDDLYGIQVTQDEEGNTQKYQFKFRTTDDGQLEAIPETIELLPNEEETQTEDSESNEVLVQEIQREETAEVVQETPVFFFEEEGQEAEVQETQVYIQEEQAEEEEEAIEEYVEEPHVEEMAVFIKGERQSPVFEEEQQEDADDDNLDIKGLHYGEEIHHEEHYEEIEDVKAGILDDNLTLRATQTNIKHELLQEECQTNMNYCVESQSYDPFEVQEEVTPEVDEQTISSLEEEVAVQEEHYSTVGLDEAQETVLQYQQYIPGDIQQVYEEPDTTDGDTLQEETYDHLFIQQHAIDKSMEIAAVQEEEVGQFVGDVCAENDSDNDDYQIVEGLHVTADGEMPNEGATVLPQPETVLQEVIEKPRVPERANILKQKSLLKPLVDIKPKTNKTLVYYVVPHVEKENVNSFSVNHTSYRPIKPNPRTVLKSSFVEPPRKEPEVVKAAIVDERLNKRFARSKEAMQAKLFNNFISKTTIPHAPVRQTRLPRKQQIKPVDNRRNEEIIVQEVMVSSKGFIENIEEKLKNKDKLEITGYVVLTDSDDDYDPKQDNTKKKKHRKHKDNQTVDSDSDVSVIEIRSDDDEDPTEEENPKRGRGRPKKSPEMSEDSDSNKRRRGRPPKSTGDVEESPTKKSRTDSDEDSIKKEINCPHCTKTFPNQNSLSTHIQHHNLENSLRNKATRTFEYKHKCDDCQATFKNGILLKRHACEKRAKPRTKTECVVCKKTFTTALELTVHKRSHVKENLVNVTSSTKVSPKKMVPRASTSQFKSPKRVVARPTATLKCKECSRVCYSQESLALHEKTHRKFPCTGCGTTFPSRLLLDAHVRVSCVKAASPSNKRLSFKVRKSFVQSPRRRSMKFSRRSALPVVNSTSQLNASSVSSNGMLRVKVACDSCGEQFNTFQEKFKHQVKMHGMETPDKSILVEQKKLLHKPKNVHGGIPARDGLRKAFAPMRTKIAIFASTKEADQS